MWAWTERGIDNVEHILKRDWFKFTQHPNIHYLNLGSTSMKVIFLYRFGFTLPEE